MAVHIGEKSSTPPHDAAQQVTMPCLTFPRGSSLATAGAAVKPLSCEITLANPGVRDAVSDDGKPCHDVMVDWMFLSCPPRVCDHVFGEGNAVGMGLRTGSAAIPPDDDGDAAMGRAMRRRGKDDSVEIRHSADGTRPADNAGLGGAGPSRRKQRPAPPVLRYRNFRMISPSANNTRKYPDAMVVFRDKPFSFKADSTSTGCR